MSSRRSSLGTISASGRKDCRIAGTFTYAWARPDIPDANVLAKTLLGTLEVDYPFYRRQAETITRLGRHGLRQPGREARRNRLTRDRLRVAFARFGIDALSDDFSDPGLLGRGTALAPDDFARAAPRPRHFRRHGLLRAGWRGLPRAQ